MFRVRTEQVLALEKPRPGSIRSMDKSPVESLFTDHSMVFDKGPVYKLAKNHTILVEVVVSFKRLLSLLLVGYAAQQRTKKNEWDRA